ncbi:MAG: MlaD family protein [Chromatiaceae bacterium]|jgi:phospholipid/cholesterol/gamma-HCH transport system substrate-binding protein/paraquat-inducible protein B
MEKEHRYFRLGLFVILTVAALLGVLFILGGRSLFQPTLTAETYFNESVSGLDIGSPVKYRGIPLGSVSQISSSATLYERDVPVDQRKSYIVVRMKVATSQVELEQLRREIPEYVKRGLRAQTQIAGVTGQLYVSMDDPAPPVPPQLPFDWTPEHIYIPSAPSLTSEIVGNAQKFLASLNATNIDALAKNLNTLVETLNRKADAVGVEDLSEAAVGLLTDARTTVSRLDRIIAQAPVTETLARLDSASKRLDDLLADPGLKETVDRLASASTRIDTLLADPGLKRTVDNSAAFTASLRDLVEGDGLERTIKNLDQTIQRIDALVGDNQYDVRVIVQDLRATADNLRSLSETAKRYPAGIFLGGPPARTELPWKGTK